MRSNKILAILVPAGVLIMICGCSWFKKDKPPPPPEPTRIVLQFETAGDINPNMAGRASPVLVRIYQLKSYSAFEKADFVSLYEKGGETLGKELLDKEDIYLKPTEKRTLFYDEVPEEIRTLGILAAFRSYHQGQWKAAASVQENKTNVINVFINGTSLQIK